MGEYIQLVSGELVKLGTCEDLFYVTHAWVKQQVEAGAKGQNCPAAEYLNPKHGWRYRFTWPDEDGRGDDYNRAHVVTAPAGLYADVEHYRVSHFATPISQRGKLGGGYGVSIFTACPLSKDPPECSSVPGIVEIYEQRPIDGRLWVVCRCPYCGAMFRLPPDQAAELVAHIRRAYPRDAWTLTIADLIEQGYSEALR